MEHDPKHRRYCAKSNMACLVLHSDGICPDVRDCEACKLEKTDTTQTTPSEEWASEFREFFDKNLKPTKQTLGNLERELIVNLMRTMRADGYEKGVRDSLEVVERIESDPPSESIEETLAFQKACNESIEAISTLLT